jgi:hypothetical protein
MMLSCEACVANGETLESDAGDDGQDGKYWLDA